MSLTIAGVSLREKIVPICLSLPDGCCHVMVTNACPKKPRRLSTRDETSILVGALILTRPTTTARNSSLGLQ